MKIIRNIPCLWSFLDLAIYGKSHLDDSERSSRDTSRSEWTRTRNFNEAAHLARHGWREGCQKIKDISDRIENVVASKIERPVVQHDVAGAFPDVGRFIQGLPDCMGSFDQFHTNGHGKVVSIVTNQVASSSVDAEQLMNRGAAVCSLVHALTQLGYATEIEAFIGTEVGESSIETRIPIKRSTEPLEIDRIAFSCAHPSFLRRIMFSFWETQGPRIVDIFNFKGGGSYGCPMDIPEGGHRGDIHLGKVDYQEPQWQSQETAAEWVLQQLEKRSTPEPTVTH